MIIAPTTRNPVDNSISFPHTMPMKILAVSGSIRRASTNTAMLRTLTWLTRPRFELHLFDGLADLPYYTPDLDQDGDEAPATVRAWRAAIREADGVIIACPEYAHSIPGVLKNALDWIVSSAEFHHRPVVLTNAYGNRDRGVKSLTSLAYLLRVMDARVVATTVPTIAGEEADASAPVYARSVRDALELLATA